MCIANADGQFLLACNNQYFLSKVIARSQLEAESECCKYGMKLLTIETEDELKCLADANIGFYINTKSKIR